MSGGSFDYLFAKTPMPTHELQRMAEDADAAGFERGGAALAKIQANFHKLAQEWEEAEEFMRSFEWWRSNDYTRDQVEEAERDLPPQMKIVYVAPEPPPANTVSA